MRRTSLIGAVVFALVVTCLWSVMVAFEDEHFATAIGYALLVINLGGAVATLIIQLCAGAVMMAAGIANTGTWADVIPQWVWYIPTVGTVFVGALIQGFVYAVILDGVMSVCRRRRRRLRGAGLRASSEPST